MRVPRASSAGKGRGTPATLLREHPSSGHTFRKVLLVSRKGQCLSADLQTRGVEICLEQVTRRKQGDGAPGGPVGGQPWLVGALSTWDGRPSGPGGRGAFSGRESRRRFHGSCFQGTMACGRPAVAQHFSGDGRRAMQGRGVRAAWTAGLVRARSRVSRGAPAAFPESLRSVTWKDQPQSPLWGQWKEGL